MKLFATLALSIFNGALSAAPVPKEVRNESPCHGSWKLMKLDHPGGGESTGTKQCWTIGMDGDVRFSGPGEQSEEICFRLTFHPETSPKQVDYQTKSMDKPYSGIYEVDGVSLKLAIDFNGGPRPKGFEPNRQFYTYHFVRAGESK